MQIPDGIKEGALVQVQVMSIYNNYTAKLPSRMAWLTPDAATGLSNLIQAVEGVGGSIFVSDMFRTEQQQARANYDYLTGHNLLTQRAALVGEYPYLSSYTASNKGRGKRAYSPPPGGSVHEAARAIDFDLDVSRLGIDQTQFATLAYSTGWNNIVGGVSGMGDPERVDIKEEWHWEFRGSFQKVYDDVFSTTDTHKLAYKAMVKSMINAIKD